MSWNFDDDVIRVPRSILRVVAPEQNKPADSSGEWPRVQVVLMRVLGDFPAARDAVVKGIRELFAKRNEPSPQWAT
jgi:hypothetical protein